MLIIAGHSSGSFVAHEFLNFISDGGLDPHRMFKLSIFIEISKDLLSRKVIYYNLDGGSSGYGPDIANYLIKV